MAGQIPRSTTAFSKDKPRRATRGRKPVNLDLHRNWIKSLPSLITNRCEKVEVAHISMADPSVGKTSRGKSQKHDDVWVVPLSQHLHLEIHKIGERQFQQKYGLDLNKIAMALYQHSGDDDIAGLIVSESKRDRK